MSTFFLLAAIAVGLSLAMAGAWTVARRPGQAGWADACWSFAVGAGGVAASLVPAPDRPGARGWLVAVLIAAWSLRLGGHIALRNRGNADDPRYAELRRQWGQHADARLWLFLQVQAAAGWVLALTVMAAARNPAPFLAWSDFAGAAVLAAAVFGEGVADRQLARFRANPANKGRICDRGLWGLSRHPNYFCEWLGWTGYALIALGPDFGFDWRWWALSGPVMIYALLVHVSGIPPLEAHMLRKHGDAFRNVQRRVRPFWPIPRDWRG